jgi:hypothetical protein
MKPKSKRMKIEQVMDMLLNSSSSSQSEDINISGENQSEEDTKEDVSVDKANSKICEQKIKPDQFCQKEEEQDSEDDEDEDVPLGQILKNRIQDKIEKQDNSIRQIRKSNTKSCIKNGQFLRGLYDFLGTIDHEANKERWQLKRDISDEAYNSNSSLSDEDNIEVLNKENKVKSAGSPILALELPKDKTIQKYTISLKNLKRKKNE